MQVPSPGLQRSHAADPPWPSKPPPASRGRTHRIYRAPASRIHRCAPRGSPSAGQRCQAGHRDRGYRAGSGRGGGKGAVSKVKAAERGCCDCPRPQAGDSHMFLKPGGELRPASTALGGLDSKGEPAHVTDELHALGRRLWTRRPLGTGGSSKPLPTLPGAETAFLQHQRLLNAASRPWILRLGFS